MTDITVVVALDITLAEFRRLIVLVRISLAEPLRDRVAYFWGLGYPLVSFLLIVSSRGGKWVTPEYAGRYILYIAFVNSVYATGMTLLWRRDSGFMKAFVRDRAAFCRLLASQAASSAVYTLFLASLFAGIAAALGTFPAQPAGIARVVFACLLASVLASAGSFACLWLPLSVRNGMAALNMVTFFVAIASFFLYGLEGFWASLIVYLNPVSVLSLAFFGAPGDAMVATARHVALGWGAGLIVLGGLVVYTRRPTLNIVV